MKWWPMAETTELDVPQTTHVEGEPEPAAPAPAEPEDKRALSPREEAMARIAAHHEERRQQELAEDAERMGVAAPEPPAPEPQPEPAPEPESQVAPEAPAAPVAPEPKRHRVEVGGAVFDVDDAQLHELARMGAVANQALAHYQRQPQPQAAPSPAAAHPSAPPAAALDDETAKALVRRITYGDEAEGAKALQEAISLARPAPQPQIDPARVAQFATQQAIQQMELRRNLETIGQEYPDVFNDSTLSQLAALKLHEIRQRDSALRVQKPDLELYREACNMVRGALAPREPQPQSGGERAPAATQAAPPAQPMAERLERKRAAPRNPSAVDRRSAAPETPRPPTGSEIVDAMRKSRGQMSMRS